MVKTLFTKRNICHLLSIISLILPMAFTGCASQNSAIKDENAAKADTRSENAEKEEVGNVRISEFILGVGDTVEISVYRQDDLKRTVKIDNSGRIMFPLIGDVQAAGVGVFQLRDELRQRLSKYLVDPQVVVNISTVQSQKVMVLGEVNNPGVFTLDTEMGILESISKAGGTTRDAKMGNVLLVRRGQGKPEVASLNLKKALNEGNFSQNTNLQNGDIVYVPRVAIANVSRFFSHLSEILSPFVMFETGVVLWPTVKDVLQGKDLTGSPVSIPTR